MLKSWALIAAIFLGAPLSACAQTADAMSQAPISRLEPLKVITENRTYKFKVEIADDDLERQKGLMYRERLAKNRGMLFLFPDMRPRAFWMRNTLIPLDIIYISDRGVVVSIQKSAVPFNETPLPSYGYAQVVLEVQGGLTDALGIKVGDRIEHRFFDGKGPKPQ